MEITAQHNLCYETTGTMSVTDIAKSLLANERMILEACSLLTEIYPDLVIEKKSVTVAKVRHQSPLKELFAVVLFATYQDELTKEVPEMIENVFGYQVPDNMDAVVTVLVLIAAMQVITVGIEKLLPGKSTKKLENELNEKINIASKLTGATKEDITKAIEVKLTKTKSNVLLKKAYDFFLPAKLSGDCEITTNHGFGVSEDAIKEIPNEIDLVEQDEIQTYELSNATVEVHRTDRDFNKQGWRAVISDVSDKPLKMELSAYLMPSELYGAVEIKGDVIIVEEKQLNGEYQPKAIHLLSVHEVFNS